MKLFANPATAGLLLVAVLLVVVTNFEPTPTAAHAGFVSAATSIAGGG